MADFFHFVQRGITGHYLPTATTALRTLEKLGIVHEVTGNSYGKLYAYTDYLGILGEEE